MRRQALARSAVFAVALLSVAASARAAENFAVKALVPTFGGSTGLGANVSTIIALRLWTTLRPRPIPNPTNLYFGVGQIEWSRRVLDESAEVAMQAARDTRSNMALWGNVEVYGPGVLVTTNLIVPASQASPGRRETWTVRVRNVELQLGLPNASYQFSPLLISNEVLANYSRPDRVRLCPDKRMDCDGALLTNPFRAIRLDGDFALVRQPSGSVGWAWLPNLSEAQGEVVDFTSALISYLRGDFEQAERFFERVGNSKADGVVRHDAALLAALSRFRRGQGIDALQDVHTRNPYSLFAVQALVMAHIVTATAERGEARRTRVNEAKTLVASYRDLFPPRDPWLSGADRSLRLLN